MPYVNPDAIRQRDEHIAELERQIRAKGEMLLSLDRRIEELEAAAQAVVAVADGDMNRELLDAIDALDAELEDSTEKK